MTAEESPSMSAGRSFLTALVRLSVLVLIWGAILFGLSGDFGWWMAWAFIGVYVVIGLITQVAIGPELRAERAEAITGESTQIERIVTILAVIGQFGTLIVAALDRRWWQVASLVPFWLQWVALIAMAAGLLFGVWAMLANRFFSSAVRIQADRGHSVITTGPYRLVRHPGYSGSILLALATPLILGSLWAFIPALIMIGALVLRTLDEDRTLLAELEGYAEYAQQTRYRLLPGIW